MLKNFLSQIELRSGFKNDQNWAHFAVKCILFSFILHLIAVFKSSGFYHSDEHFQIIEFLNYKLGRSSVADLPIEFSHHMRPWLFSSVLMWITAILRSLGISNPFTWALAYRAFSSLVGWLTTSALILCCYEWFSTKDLQDIGKADYVRQWRKWAALAMTLIWYLPSLHARTSSENLGGSVFFLGIALFVLFKGESSRSSIQSQIGLQNDRPSSFRDHSQHRLNSVLAVVIGLLFGFSFHFRYQVATMVVGALLWMWIIARVSIRELIPLLLGLSASLSLGFLADRWGYGEWTFTPWNYLKYNIIDNHVSDADTSPWWDYFRRAFTESWPIIGFLTLLSFPIAWIRNPKHILTWSMFPLFLTHEIIGHKELRFLWPMIHPGGILIVMSVYGHSTLKIHGHSTLLGGLSALKNGQLSPRLFGWFKWPVKALIAWNLVGLVSLTLIPAWMPIRFYEKLYDFKSPGLQVYYKDNSLFSLGGAIMNFYRPENVPFVPVNQYSDFVQALKSDHQVRWFFSSRAFLPDDSGELKGICTVEFSALPVWLHNFNYKNVMERVTNWTLYRCQAR